MQLRAVVIAGALAAGLAAGAVPAQAAPAACGDPVTHQIADVQGAGAATPLAGQTVRVEGVVTGDFQNADQLKGFFVQDPTPDRDPATSDGIFVYGTQPVAPGDRVRVTGRVSEYSGATQITPTAVDACGRGSIRPAPVRLPLPPGVTLERYEGVLTTFLQPLTATETYQLGRYGEVTLAAGGRLYQPTDGRPGVTQAANNARRLLLDDGSTVQNPASVPFTAPRAVRIGDVTAGVTGVVSEAFGLHRLQPTRKVTFAPLNARPARPAAVRGNVKVASFNTLNWFTTLRSRGATTEAERDRQLAKLVAALRGLDADVVGLMEVENNGDTAIGALVEALNAAVGAGTYAWVRHPYPGDDQIHVAAIYKTAKVRPQGDAISSDDPVYDRPPLVQTFAPVAGGTPFTLLVNHLKSKGCTDATGGDADQGDGQGCYNARRVAQATALRDLAASVPNPLVLGDLNAYAAEDPVKILKAAGFVSQTERYVRPADRYSYVFDGQSGELDHVLAGGGLTRKVSGATIWHINADEPLILDYNTEYNPPGLYRPDAYRSSDHDPVLVGLDLR
ncbi:ExeM/NucH family extracellular endonuclease [Actinomadura flavalba]|uniref:ExeM/NucH family extracellular endonuclease n=1 Tax=Actinomadura flavalba TaxID=1120938 RepID=UPI000475AAD8|nr:ExeM/NucH family extracellular endonuclease [Actinomadura flavalba]